MITRIGNYELGQSIDVSSLKELPLDNIVSTLKNAPSFMKSKNTKDFSEQDYKDITDIEKAYETENLSFLSANWSAFVGVISGKIARISAYYTTTSKEDADFMFRKTFTYVTNDMGKHNKNPFLSKMFIWYCDEGNVLLEKASMWGQHGVTIVVEHNRKGVHKTLKAI